MPRMCRAFVVLLVLLIGTCHADAATLPLGQKHLVFAIAYRATDAAGAGGDFVVLGHYDFTGDSSANLYYYFYDGRANRRGAATPKRQPYSVPASKAAPGQVQIPSYTLAESVPGVWSYDAAGGVLRVHVASMVHEWALRDPAGKLFVPRRPYTNADDGSHTVNGWTYSNTRGYAYLTDLVTLPRHVARGDLLPEYHGEIQSLVTPRGEASRWTQKKSDLIVKGYQPTADPDVLALQYASRWVQQPTAVFSTLLLNYAPHSTLLLYHNGGHDFNRNGVFDEPGHTMQMYAIHDGSKIAAIVYVEHSYQTSGQPILSVGHYYAP